MPYYHKCDLCGANLDPGEKCTCVEDAKREIIAKEIQQKVKATMLLSTFGKRGKKNGRNAKPY